MRYIFKMIILLRYFFLHHIYIFNILDENMATNWFFFVSKLIYAHNFFNLHVQKYTDEQVSCKNNYVCALCWPFSFGFGTDSFQTLFVHCLFHVPCNSNKFQCSKCLVSEPWRMMKSHIKLWISGTYKRYLVNIGCYRGW